MSSSEPIRSRIMVGSVLHRRVQPFAHGFRYRVMMFRLDLAEVETLGRRLRLFGVDCARPVSFHRSDHLRQVPELLGGYGIAAGAVARIELVTHCRVFGYVFNPISFFFCYAADDRLLAVVCEVHNTFGETHAYVLTGDKNTGEWREKKVFHVSPFFTLDGTYRFRFSTGNDRLDVRIDLHRAGGLHFVSHLRLTARPLTDAEVLRGLVRHPFNTITVIGAIHWQALRLWWKGAPYSPKPPYDPDSARRLSSS